VVKFVRIGFPIALACGGWAIAYTRQHSQVEMLVGVVVGAIGTILTLMMMTSAFTEATSSMIMPR
jgi:uncharacterized membrane protein (UPF0136 family)